MERNRIEVDLLESVDVLSLVRSEMCHLVAAVAGEQAELLNRLASTVSVVVTRLSIVSDQVARIR
jgi:hypothetical protein